jgi:hypothetical protein
MMPPPACGGYAAEHKNTLSDAIDIQVPFFINISWDGVSLYGVVDQDVDPAKPPRPS